MTTISFEAPDEKYPKPRCAKCGSSLYDNIHDKKSEKSPDLKCSKKECGWGFWGFDPKKKKGSAPDKAKSYARSAPPNRDNFDDGIDDDLPF